MIQIEHIYHFLFDNLFKDFRVCHLPGGVPEVDKELSLLDICVYEKEREPRHTVFFYDQEPLLPSIVDRYLNIKEIKIFDPLLITSEKSDFRTDLYYFFHGFAALDWFRGYHALNHNKQVVKDYKKDYITFNRTITGDRAYRKTFIELLRDKGLLDKGLVSYGVVDEHSDGERLVIDGDHIPASASAGIPTTLERVDYLGDTPDYDAFWHVVTETIFDYRKLHLTEKIFKPIVSKQPFMLLAAPGNLQYLRSYGFRTFENIIDESYDGMAKGRDRIDAVVSQLEWYCSLSADEKTEIQKKCEPIVEYNFQHFYGKFREIITDELLDNSKKLFSDIGYDDSGIDYQTIRNLLI